MIPYIHLPAWRIGGWEVDLFSILIATAAFLGVRWSARRAESLGLDPQPVYGASILTLICGYIGAHLVHVLAYEPQRLSRGLWELLPISGGISSFGAYVAGGLATWVYWRREKVPFYRYADAGVFGVVSAWTLGRIGCALAHDHPGRRSDFFLAVRYPGGSRHDLGLYEFIFLVLLTISLWTFFRQWMKRPGYREGSTYAAVLVLYGTARVILDSLRATDLPGADARYFDLTPAQYGSILFVLLGLAVFVRNSRRPWPGTSTPTV